MRFSLVLLRRQARRDFSEKDAKLHWKQQDKFMNVLGLQLSPTVEKAFQDIHSVEDTFKSDRYEKEINHATFPLQALAEQWTPPVDLKSYLPHDPRSNQAQPALLFDWRKRFSLGLSQAASLTNCITYDGLSPPILRAYEALCKKSPTAADTAVPPLVDYSDDFLLEWLQRCILHSHIWHTEEERLPRRFRPSLPIWKHKLEYGITPNHSSRFLFANLHRGITQGPLLKSLPELLHNSVTTRSHELETFYHFGDPASFQRVQFHEQHDIMVNRSQPLTPVFSMEESQYLSSQSTLASVWPLSPLIDLKLTHHYRPDSSDGLASDEAGRAAFPHPHLFYATVDVPNLWSDFQEPEMPPFTVEHRKSIALMKCFAQTVATAHRLYADRMGDRLYQDPLPEPILCHAVLSDSVFFDFVTVQLNTLCIREENVTNNILSEQKLKNFAWIDAGRALFEKRIPVRAKLNTTVYRNVNIDVYKRILSLFCHELFRQ